MNEIPEAIARRRRDEQKRRRQITSAANTIAFVTAVVGFGVAVFANPDRGSLFGFDSTGASAERSSKIEKQVADLQAQIAGLKQGQQALPGTGAGETQLARRIAEVEARQVRLEKTLAADPVKSLEVPMLRRDLNSLKESAAQNADSVRQDIDQIYDLTKWLLGALALGVFSLVVSNYFSRKA